MPLSLEMFCLQGLRPEVRCFQTEQVHLSSCICQRRPSTGLLEDARLPLDTNARFLGSLAAVAFPCLAWTPSNKEGPATRYFRLLGAPKSQLSRLSMPCRCLPSDSLSAFGPIYYCLLYKHASSRHQQALVAAALPTSTFSFT